MLWPALVRMADLRYNARRTRSLLSVPAPLPRPVRKYGLSRFPGVAAGLLYLVYLDEFGHVGPFIARDHFEHKTSPIFGIGGFVLPYENARVFSSWFFRLRNNLLAFEIARDGAQPSRWEKKGSALFTTTNITKYAELTRAMRRILSKIRALGGFVLYVGFEKRCPSGGATAQRLYGGVLRRVLKRLNTFSRAESSHFLVILDDNDKAFSRDVILRKAQQVMFGSDYCDRLVETPLQVESLIYHNVQAADWICGLLGRFGAHQVRPVEFADWGWAKERFEVDISRVSKQSDILTNAQLDRHFQYATRGRTPRSGRGLR